VLPAVTTAAAIIKLDPQPNLTSRRAPMADHSSGPGLAIERTPGVDRPSRRIAAGVVLALVLAATAATVPACLSRQAAGTGVRVGLDCEADNIRAFLSDATTLAIEAVAHWISGSGQVDRDGLARDAAKIRTDLGRCALDAAVAALAARGAGGASAPEVAEAAPMVVDAAQLVSTYAEIRAGLGWPAARSGGGPT
jgi:hypothetical protein